MALLIPLSPVLGVVVGMVVAGRLHMRGNGRGGSDKLRLVVKSDILSNLTD